MALAEAKMAHCVACSDPKPRKDLLETRCGYPHYYCTSCLTSAFELAMKDETCYPPHCCGTSLVTASALRHLPQEVSRRLKAKQLELKTRDKTYCHRPTCSTFIAPHSIHHHEAFCQKCRARTCSKCKNAWHFGPCTFAGEAELMETAEREKWQRCPGCRRLVEKDEGCNGMECRCGMSFCYGCGEENCECVYDAEEDIDDDLEDDLDAEVAVQEK